MKHLTRVRTMQGFSHLPSAERPSRVVIQHQDSFEEYALPLTWDVSGGESAGPRPLVGVKLPVVKQEANVKAA